MDRRAQKGYARILKDLQQLELSDQFRTSLQSAKASIDELERLIVRLEKLGNDPEDLNS
ncbi:MAG: hypothetical protein ACPGYT_09600 [Nitrospirales bacterium]